VDRQSAERKSHDTGAGKREKNRHAMGGREGEEKSTREDTAPVQSSGKEE